MNGKPPGETVDLAQGKREDVTQLQREESSLFTYTIRRLEYQDGEVHVARIPMGR